MDRDEAQPREAEGTTLGSKPAERRDEWFPVSPMGTEGYLWDEADFPPPDELDP